MTREAPALLPTSTRRDVWGRPRVIVPVLNRLMSKVVKEDSGCWTWTAYKNPSGYGIVSDTDNSMQLAHRVAYREMVGPIPEGLTIDHLCRVRHCINPAHLEAVTSRENTLRGVSPAARNAALTHCANGHELTAENTDPSKTGKRECSTCRRARARKVVACSSCGRSVTQGNLRNHRRSERCRSLTQGNVA